MGRDEGIERFSPRCKRRNSKPASSSAACVNGGVLNSPCNQVSSLSSLLTSPFYTIFRKNSIDSPIPLGFPRESRHERKYDRKCQDWGHTVSLVRLRMSQPN